MLNRETIILDEDMGIF